MFRLLLKPFYKLLVITLTLLAFVGQSFAYAAVPCNMAKHSNTTKQSNTQNTVNKAASDHIADCMEMAMSDLSQQEITADNHQMNCDDCCGSTCKCPHNACSSGMFVAFVNINQPMVVTFEKALRADFFITEFTNQSLYRPPITQYI